MGKRELLLVVIFVVIGAVVYQATAPPAPEGSRGFSLTEMFRAARSGMGERNARRLETREVELTLPDDVGILALDDFRGRVTITGSERLDLRARLDATLHGVDEADLDQQAETLRLSGDIQGADATLAVGWRDMGAPPDYVLTIEVPARLRVRLGGRGTAEVSATAGLDLREYRGDVLALQLSGPISGLHRDGRAEFGAGAVLDFETRRGTVRAPGPAAVSLKALMSDIEVMDAGGPVTIDQTRSTLEILRAAGPVTITGTGGTLKLREVTAPVEITAERLTVSTTMAAAVPMRIAVENDDVDVTLPAGGVTVEASTAGGDLRVPGDLEVVEHEGRRSATGAVNGGGPLVSLTVQRGTLTVRRSPGS
jgi:hypothetical protein